jgi:hypothetical protein
MSSYEIYIEGYKYPTGNQIKGMRSWEYAQVRDTIKQHLARYFAQRSAPPNNKYYMEVHCTLGRKKLMDLDNMYTTMKPWLDMLQKSFLFYDDPFDSDIAVLRPVIRDDSPKYINLKVDIEVGRKYFMKIVLTPTDQIAPISVAH